MSNNIYFHVNILSSVKCSNSIQAASMHLSTRLNEPNSTVLLCLLKLYNLRLYVSYFCWNININATFQNENSSKKVNYHRLLNFKKTSQLKCCFCFSFYEKLMQKKRCLSRLLILFTCRTCVEKLLTCACLVLKNSDIECN